MRRAMTVSFFAYLEYKGRVGQNKIFGKEGYCLKFGRVEQNRMGIWKSWEK
jgi:hypothetical protein